MVPSVYQFVYDVIAFLKSQIFYEAPPAQFFFMVILEIYLQVKIDELVKPRKAIKDYRTDITGISPGDLDGVSCSLADVQVIVVYFLCGWFTLP